MLKRKVWLINPRFQLSFIGWMLSISIAVIVIFYCANLYFFKSYLEQGKLAGLPAGHAFFVFIGDQYRLMNWIFAIASIVVTLFIIITGLILSHRVAGPLYRLNKYFNEVADGKPISEVKFRPSDYFLELAESYNKHTNSLMGNNKKNP